MVTGDGTDRLLTIDLADEIEFLTARARSIGTVTANAALAALDLKVRSYSVLALAASGQNPSQRELAAFLSLDGSQIVALVDGLEERGCITRTPDARDRRSNAIVATESGRQLYARARDAVRKAEEHSLRSLDDDERRQLRALLRRMAFPDHASD